MNDREIARIMREADAEFRATIEAIHTPAFRAELLAEINANNDDRERIIGQMLARERQLDGDE